jgi:glycosyltransferase involved in cell wall biosynthesis
VIERYARAMVYVQASRIAADGDRDGIPNVLLEAMATGVPVVATRVSGIPELVHDRHTGLLVDPDEPAALADAIGTLIDDEALRGRLAQAGRATVLDAFDNDRNLRQLVGLLNDTREPDVQAAPRALA